MEWFKPGLDHDALRKEYRKLCKMYHPDVSKDPDANEKMKEINYQFDKYFVQQARFEYGWASEARAREAANMTRRAILTMMYYNKELEYYTTRLEFEHESGLYRTFWGWERRSRPHVTYIVGHGVGDSWEDFKGGLAYVSYEKEKYGEKPVEVNVEKLPATITPASLEEVYWFNKDHWMDSKHDRFREVDCRFGRIILHMNGETWDPDKQRADMMMKVSLPEKFRLGHPDPDTNALYESKSIQMVNIRYGMLGKCKNVVELTGADIPYIMYQDCTKEEFMDTHDVDYVPQLAHLIPLRRVRDRMLPGCPDPMIEYYHQKGILKFYCSQQNFRLMYGTFDMRELEQNMELVSIDDAEMIQDWLDEINKNFDTELKKMVKSGRVHMKI